MSLRFTSQVFPAVGPGSHSHGRATPTPALLTSDLSGPWIISVAAPVFALGTLSEWMTVSSPASPGKPNLA